MHSLSLSLKYALEVFENVPAVHKWTLGSYFFLLHRSFSHRMLNFMSIAQMQVEKNLEWMENKNKTFLSTSKTFLRKICARDEDAEFMRKSQTELQTSNN